MDRSRSKKHGTPNGYSRLGCRCAPCTEAETAYRRHRRLTAVRNRPWNPTNRGRWECGWCGARFAFGGAHWQHERAHAREDAAA